MLHARGRDGFRGSWSARCYLCLLGLWRSLDTVVLHRAYRVAFCDPIRSHNPVPPVDLVLPRAAASPRAATPRHSLTFRVLDISFAAIGFVVLSPLIALVALAILLETGRPVFYVQERLGLGRRPFRLVKFRTMVQDAEADGPRWAAAGDARVTPLGRMLRRTRLDELPQLINILRGDMSFVGPRPIREHFASILEAQESSYGGRFLVKPGLTGWAQLYAPYGSTVDEQLEKIPYDLKYLEGLTALTYCRLILLTTLSVARRAGR